MELTNFAKKRPYLFWSTNNFESLSEDIIVETVLNLGTWEDAQELMKILGIKKTALIFQKKSEMKRNNFRPEIKNYFELYFKRYA